MSALIPAHRRAERFAAVVDGASRPAALDQRSLALLDVVGALRTGAVEVPVPRAAYVADLRARLMAEADTALVPTDRRLLLHPHHTGRRQSRLTAAAAGVVIVVGSAGMSVAAQSSLPGESLYPIKRGIEQTREALTFSDAARGNQLLDQASARLSETDGLISAGASDSQVATSLVAFSTSAGHGADLLFRSYQSTSDTDSVAAVRDFAGTAMGQLTDLSAHAPASLRPSFLAAAQLLADLDQQARVYCADCGARSPLAMPSDLSLSSATSLESLLGEQALKDAVAARAAAAEPAPTPVNPGPATPATPTLPDLTGPVNSATGATGTTGTSGVPGAGDTTGKSPLGIPPLPSALPSVPTVVNNLTDGVTGTLDGTVTGLTDGLGLPGH